LRDGNASDDAAAVGQHIADALQASTPRLPSLDTGPRLKALGKHLHPASAALRIESRK
jgi:hypothetical protein